MKRPVSGKKAVGYDRYVDYRKFGLAVLLFVATLFMPIPDSMLDVAVEYTYGSRFVLDHLTTTFYGKEFDRAEQWEAFSARILEQGLQQGMLTKEKLLSRDEKWMKSVGLEVHKAHLANHRKALAEVSAERFFAVMQEAHALRYERLSLADLDEGQRKKVDETAKKIRLIFALVLFVVTCFLTEAMPLPGVAFCIGLILVFGGVVSRREVASMFWDDACWFIMGSLMFAAAFVKTGVDKRICLMMFKVLAKPNLKLITGILILVIAPASAFISDHALAAMFLPIAMILYSNSLNEKVPVDPELAKMLILTVGMACNIGGFGSPSGGARNVIMMTYVEDMFGINIGFAEWMLYACPFVLVMMPVLWFLVNVRFKPKILDLSEALNGLRRDIEAMGGWSRKQIVTLIIFVVMVTGWILEKDVLTELLGVRLGLGVLAVAGAMAFLLAGVVNWRDYQERVDWGVVWLYAGAIIFGKVMAESGTAYWMARSIIELVEPLGIATGTGLVALGSLVTAGLTQLMADGPAAACVGPITLNMAAVSNPGSAVIPFMGMATACASSMAYLLVIGTPPNAIIYASGHLEMKDFLRLGIPCLIIGLIVLIALQVVYWHALGFQGLPLQ